MKSVKLFIVFSIFSLFFCSISVQLFAIEKTNTFLINTEYNAGIPLQNEENKSVLGTLGLGNGGVISLEYRPLDILAVNLKGGFSLYKNKTQSIKDWNYFYGAAGAGIRFPLNDRLYLLGDLNVGLYSGNHLYSDNSRYIFSGFMTDIQAGASYRFTPVISAYAKAGWNMFIHRDNPLNGFNIGLGFSVNLTESFKNKTYVEATIDSVDPVFPVLYSWYNDNSFGIVNVLNGEDTGITDVSISFFSEQYMSRPKACGTFEKIERDETVQIDLTAFFNESTLELTEPVNANCSIIVEYKKLGLKRKATIPVTVPVMNRNNMSWDDDRRAAVFVSAKDIEAVSFAKQVSSVVRKNIDLRFNSNIQYAAALFETLNLFGLNYVIDPNSSYSANVGSTSIDFLQFPFQTLNYRGGDCDDLSILYCSLLESLGIESAFITVPGHIYTAINTGLTVSEAKVQFIETESFNKSFIVYKDAVWIPLEITMIKDGFYKAWRYGITEWNKALPSGNAQIYPMHENWKLYPPVTPSGADSEIFLPSSEKILQAFQKSMSQVKSIIR